MYFALKPEEECVPHEANEQWIIATLNAFMHNFKIQRPFMQNCNSFKKTINYMDQILLSNAQR